MKRMLFLVLIQLIVIIIYAKDVVIIQQRMSPTDKRDVPNTELLACTLQETEKDFGEWELKTSELFMVQDRYKAEITDETSGWLNVSWTSDIRVWNKTIIVPLPTYKGALGYRVFFIKKENQPLFSKVTENDLKKLYVGQGKGWTDVKLFEYNGYNVLTSPMYENLFKMLDAERFDYFSRGITEIIQEYEDRKDKFPSLHIEETILLRYVQPSFFVVHIKFHNLAKRIETGFERCIANGRHNEIFNKYFGSYINKLGLKERRLFLIENPFLDKRVPLNRKELWYTP